VAPLLDVSAVRWKKPTQKDRGSLVVVVSNGRIHFR
jgi:hypothetical protein